MSSARTLRPVAIVGGLRVPFVKSFTHYTRTTNQEMLSFVVEGLVRRFRLEGQRLGDVALGALMKYPGDWNLAREVVLGTSLDAHTPAFNVSRACGTSLEAAWLLALKIGAGQIESGIAGGSDTNSDLPLVLSRPLAWKFLDLRNARSVWEKVKTLGGFTPSDFKFLIPGVVEPRTSLSMGQHTEKMVQEWKISREDQDALALRSHQSGAQAYKDGFYDDLVLEFKGQKRDSIVRADTTLEKLAKLKPAFDFTGKGTLTAGNSSPLTDGAAAVLLASPEEAQAKKWPVLAHFIDAEVAALDFVHGEGLLMAPTMAVSRLLKRQGLRLQDFDIYEIHEAFAGQVLCTLKAWESAEYCRKALGRSEALGAIDQSKMNLRGGSVALGHPFSATGARILASLAKQLQALGPKKRGLISICTAGGMGVTAILES